MSILERDFTRRDALRLGVGAFAAAVGYQASNIFDAFGYAGTWQPGETVSINLVETWSYPPRPASVNGWILDWGTRIEVSRNGKTGLAYCVNPSVSLVPDAISGQMCSIWSIGIPRNNNPVDSVFPSGHTPDDAATFLWFALGGPGYDHDMWPKYYGDVLNEPQIYWTCHYLATYLIWGSGKTNYWQNGQNWISEEIIPLGGDPNLVNWLNTVAIPFMENTILPRSNEVAADFPVFAINAYNTAADTKPGNQMCIASLPVTSTAPQKGSLTVKKTVSNGDSNRKFKFKVTFTSPNNAVSSDEFELSASDNPKVFSDIVFGTKYSVAEIDSGPCTVTWTNQSGTIDSSHVDVTCVCDNAYGYVSMKKFFDTDSSD